MADVLKVRNVNDALVDGIWLLRTSGLKEDSRNGPVVVAPGPVITHYMRPTERVLWNSRRDANPVFHLMEAIWMLAGRCDAAWVSQFNSGIIRYAEDDGAFHGAYGWRWRNYFTNDQLYEVIKELRENPNTRRCVLQMWDANADLRQDKKDLPCNTHIYFDRRFGALNMTVCNRSNDIVWGAYGANAVHFSILQELIAAALGVPVGAYYQMSNNYHLYTEMEPAKTLYENPSTCEHDLYESQEVPIIPLLASGESPHQFLWDCENICVGNDNLRTHFMRRVALPLKLAYLGRKEHRRGWSDHLLSMPECDWKRAFIDWCARRDTIKGE